MTFLNPLVLFGLAAAAIPVLIHLLNIRKLKVVDFSSLRFLKELQKTRMRRLKIRQWLILLLRTLLVIFLVLAFSRPALKGSFAGIGGGRASSTVVILLDDSPSMGMRNDHGRLFDQAKDAAAQLQSTADATDELYLLRLSDPYDPALHDLPVSPAAGVKALGGMTLSLKSAAYAPFVAHGLRILAASHNANKELHLLTDGQATEFSLADSTALAGLPANPDARVFMTEIAPSHRENAAVTAFTLESRLLSLQHPLTFQGKMTNYGDQPVVNTLASFYLDGTRVAQQSVNIAPHATTQVTLSALPKRRGVLGASLHIDDDLLDADNTRYTVVRIPERIRIICIGSTPADTRFPALALAAAVDTSQSDVFTVQQITQDRLQFADFSTQDVLILSNIRSLSTADAARIVDAVRGGHNLVIFPGKDTDYNTLNSRLCEPLGIPPLTPADLAQLAPDKTGFVSFGNVDYRHPVFEGLFAAQPGKRAATPSVESPRIRTAAGLRPGTNGIPIISMTDGRPFLCEYTSAKGKILLFAVESGVTWSDFPFKGIFAPLMHRTMIYLASHQETAEAMTVGDRLRFPVHMTAEESGKAYLVRSPGGNNERVQPEQHTAAGITVFAAEPARETGIYTLVPADNGNARTPPKDAVAVNLAARESDCTEVQEEPLAGFWQRCGIAPANLHRITAPADVAREVHAARYGVELWRLFVALALACALCEMLLSRSSGPSQDREKHAALNV